MIKQILYFVKINQIVNALTGNLVTAYQELMQDVQKELSEETGDEKNN